MSSTTVESGYKGIIRKQSLTQELTDKKHSTNSKNIIKI